jgi:hypothetical protein
MRRTLPMRRPLLIGLILLGVVLFLAISAVLARVLSVPSAEQAAVTTLVQDEARGDARAMIAQIDGCSESAACTARATQDAAALTRHGIVEVLEFGQSAGFSLTSTVGTARVAWRAGGSLPIVQCVKVRRAGNALSGLHIELLEVSRRIKTSADCPARY